MVITDSFDHVIDEKGRLAIPVQIRNAMDPQIDGDAFYVRPNSNGRCLELIPEKTFDRFAGAALSGLVVDPEVARLKRFVFAMASRLEPDKQGRVILPERFMRNSKNPDPLNGGILGREVTLVGVLDRVEIWNREDYLGHMREVRADANALTAAAAKLFGSVPIAPPATN
jgi:MraZ protein